MHLTPLRLCTLCAPNIIKYAHILLTPTASSGLSPPPSLFPQVSPSSEPQSPAAAPPTPSPSGRRAAPSPLYPHPMAQNLYH